MSILTARRYREIAHLLGPELEREELQVRQAGSRFEWPIGVYALGHRHPLNGHFDVDYVGSAVRPVGDVADRVREHLRERDKAEVFTDQALWPLRSDIEEPEVRGLEGLVARALGVPRWCRKVPGGRGVVVRSRASFPSA